jgi:toxin YoeB
VKLTFTPRGWEDYLNLQQYEPKVMVRLNDLIKECLRHPFKGTGKPEPLRENWAGWWSRRINAEHRLVYRVIGKDEEQRIEVAQCRYHY